MAMWGANNGVCFEFFFLFSLQEPASARREVPWPAHNPGQRPLPLLDSSKRKGKRRCNRLIYSEKDTRDPF